jgi:hypothetical protein
VASATASKSADPRSGAKSSRAAPARRAEPDWTATAEWLAAKPVAEWNAHHLVKYFWVGLHRRCERTGISYEELCPHPVNGAALGRNFKDWLGEGKSPEYIAGLIDEFFKQRRQFKSEPWKDFLNAKGRLHTNVRRAEQASVDRHDPNVWMRAGSR